MPIKSLLVFCISIFILSGLSTQTICKDLSYDITFEKFHKAKNEKDLSKFELLGESITNSIKRKKHERRFYNSHGQPVILSAVIDHINFYNQMVSLPLISVYGVIDFKTAIQSYRHITGINNGVLGKENTWHQSFLKTKETPPKEIPRHGTVTKWGTIIHNYKNIDAYLQNNLDSIELIRDLIFKMPNPLEINVLENQGFDISKTENQTIASKADFEIIYDEKSYTITHSLEKNTTMARTYQLNKNGLILLDTVLKIRNEILINGVKYQIIERTSYSNYKCTFVGLPLEIAFSDIMV